MCRFKLQWVSIKVIQTKIIFIKYYGYRCIPSDTSLSCWMLLVYSATCRRPIHGAAGRPVRPFDLWPEESLLHQHVFTTTKTSLAASHSTPLYALSFSPPSEPRPRRRSFSIWLKLLVLLTLAASLYYVFQNVSSEQIDSCMLFIQDRVVTPLLTLIGVIGQEESSGGKWICQFAMCASAVSIPRLGPHPLLNRLGDQRIGRVCAYSCCSPISQSCSTVF